jgi:hypothetical protein
MGHVYASKVDWWIGLILLVTVAVLAASAFQFIFGPQGGAPFGSAIGLFCLAVAVWIGWIPFNTYYEFDQTELIIRSAGFRWRVALDCIVEVFPTHNPLSSPACSLDRLRVNYRNRKGRPRFVLISPRERDEFLRDLAQAAPHLKLDNDRLVSTESDL